MNMLGNRALHENQSGRTAPPWMPLWAEDAGAVPEPFRADISITGRILRQTRHVALGRHRGTRMRLHATRCAYLLFHRGGVRLRTSSGRWEIATSLHVSLHAPGEIHACEALNEEGHDCDFIAIAPGLLQRLRAVRCDEVGDEARSAYGTCEATPEIFRARRRLFVAALRPSGALNSRQIDAAVERLLALVVDRALARHRFVSSPGSRGIRARRIRLVEDATAILACEYQNDLTATQLAHRLHCSSAHLSRTFQAVTGFKLADYRRELRLRPAAYLIERASTDIGGIAVRVGFASHSHFSSVFRRRFGITPSEYLNPRAPEHGECFDVESDAKR